MNVATEYTGDCEHINLTETEPENPDETTLVTCDDCDSTYNELEGIWYL